MRVKGAWIILCSKFRFPSFHRVKRAVSFIGLKPVPGESAFGILKTLLKVNGFFSSYWKLNLGNMKGQWISFGSQGTSIVPTYFRGVLLPHTHHEFHLWRCVTRMGKWGRRTTSLCRTSMDARVEWPAVEDRNCCIQEWGTDSCPNWEGRASHRDRNPMTRGSNRYSALRDGSEFACQQRCCLSLSYLNTICGGESYST